MMGMFRFVQTTGLQVILTRYQSVGLLRRRCRSKTLSDWGKPERKSYHWLELLQVSFLSRQRFCRDKHTSFVATKAGMFVATKDKSTFVATKDKSTFVATKVLSPFKHVFCRNKSMLFRDKHVFFVTMFVEASILLSRQEWYLWQLPPVIKSQL